MGLFDSPLKRATMALTFLGATSLATPYILDTKEPVVPTQDFTNVVYGTIQRTPIKRPENTAPETAPKTTQSHKITLHQDNTLVFNNREEYMETFVDLDLTRATFARYQNQTVPKDLREAVYLAQKITGAPHQVLLLIAKAESGFDGDSVNMHSSGKGYFHTLKDTKFERLMDTVGTPLESLFPLAKDIFKHKGSRGTFFYLPNPETGRPDKARTMAYHEQISSNPYLAAIAASLKVLNDRNILDKSLPAQLTRRQPITTLDSYAQYFFGGTAGKRYAKLRRTEPNAPIWRIYGQNKEHVLKYYADEINNDGNEDFFFKDRANGIFKTIAENESYLVDTRKIPDTQWDPFESTPEFARNLVITDPEETMPQLIAQWHEEQEEKSKARASQIALLKQEP
ncbi:MAG: hypothetical protein ACPG05_05380 [Bdellovibrionales bacterium]